MSADFIERFERFCLQHKLLKPRDKVLVGVSGGADSTALLTAFWMLRDKWDLDLLAAHVNYKMRGEASDADEQYVREFCFTRNISLVVKTAPIDPNRKVEETARAIRFDYFRKLQGTYKFDRIALGHHREDQAETVLMRLFRGAAGTGLRGILPLNGDLIHPLLDFTRQELRDFLRSRYIEWREDETNDDTSRSRNLLRLELMPWIKAKFNPNIIDTLSGTARLIAETEDVLQDYVHQRMKRVVEEETEQSVSLSLHDLRNMKPLLRFHLYREVLGKLTGSEADFYQAQFHEVEKLLYTDGCKWIRLPRGITLDKNYRTLTFQLPVEELTPEDVGERVLSEIRVATNFGNYRFAMKKLKQLPKDPFEDRLSAYLDMDKLQFPLIFRFRQPGDRFQPYGMTGEKKLKDFFIDEKVARLERDRIVLLCDPERILWVCGYRVNAQVAVTSETRQILQIKAEPVTSGRARAAERKKSNETENV